MLYYVEDVIVRCHVTHDFIRVIHDLEYVALEDVAEGEEVNCTVSNDYGTQAEVDYTKNDGDCFGTFLRTSYSNA